MKHLRVATEFSLTIAITLAVCAAQESPRGIVTGNALAKKASPADLSSGKAAAEFGAQRYPRYELRADDVVDLFFEFTPEFNQTLTVQPDGYITLRGVGDVHVAGLTVPEITETIRTAYGKILQDPAIAIAGGFNSSAKHSQVVLFRRVSRDLYEAKLINVKRMLKSRDLSEDLHLKTGDTLFVPQNSLSKIRPFVPNPGVGVGTTF